MSEDSQQLDRIETDLHRAGEFDVRTATTPGALDHVGTADCLVWGGDQPEPLDLLGAVRERSERLPLVLVASDLDRAGLSEFLSAEWTEFVPEASDDAGTLLAARVRSLAGRYRTSELAESAIAALDNAHEEIAIVTADGQFTFVNRAFATCCGRDSDTLVGKSWATVFTDETVQRLEAHALPAVDGEWCWIGSATVQQADGTEHTTTVRVSALGNGDVMVSLSDGE